MFYRNFICFALSCCAVLSAVSAQDYWIDHGVSDPRNWGWSQAIVEEMSLIVEPQGAYTQVDLTMSLSTDFGQFDVNDSLEIVLDFGLPKGSIVNDSWLWVGEDIIRAELLDRWTATEIYEEIVARRQDPSLLTRRRSGDDYRYELRIFPLTRQDHVRKFRITYLVPANWSKNMVSTSLPYPFLDSFNSDPFVQIKVKSNDTWGIPTFVEIPELGFVREEGSDNYLALIAPAIYNGSDLHVSFQAPFKDGIYFSTTEGEQEDFYQLAILPAEAFDLGTTPKKTVVLIDFEDGNSSISRQGILNRTRDFLKANLSEQDSFQVFLSQLAIHPISEDWVVGSTENIDAVFNNISLSQLSNYSNLFPLLVTGVEYVNAQTTAANTDILLFSNASRTGNATTTNHRIDDIVGLMEQSMTINIIDYQTRNLSSFYTGGISYRGNAYFHSSLANTTNGIYKSTHFNSNLNIDGLFDSSEAILGQRIDIFDISTGVQNGISYDRIMPFESSGVTLNKPVFQIGKYLGDYPFTISAGGVMDGNSFGKTFQIEANDAETIRIIPQMWASHELEQLENAYSVADIQRALALSLDYRILSTRTAFLALEPGQGGEICEECEDDDNTVAVEEVLDDALVSVQLLPNPFHERVRIQVQFSEKLDIADAQFFITDAQGQQVKTFQKGEWEVANGQYTFLWDGKSMLGKDLPAGVYFFTIITPEGKKTVKLMKLTA